MPRIVCDARHDHEPNLRDKATLREILANCSRRATTNAVQGPMGTRHKQAFWTNRRHGMQSLADRVPGFMMTIYAVVREEK